MAQWGSTDDAANSVNWGAVLVRGGSGKANIAANNTSLYNNTTVGAFISGRADGQFLVDANEMAQNSGGVFTILVSKSGSGYTANAAVTVTAINGGSSAAANAHANSSGRIDAVNVETAGSGYIAEPQITIAAPSPIAFNANTTGVKANGAIVLGASAASLKSGDLVTYNVASGNTKIAELTSGGTYYIYSSNTTAVYLAPKASPDAKITVLTPGGNENGHTLTGETATAAAVVGGALNNGVAHAGWILRTEYTGGRAGRVHHETLVAFSSGAADNSGDDPVFPGGNS